MGAFKGTSVYGVNVAPPQFPIFAGRDFKVSGRGTLYGRIMWEPFRVFLLSRRPLESMHARCENGEDCMGATSPLLVAVLQSVVLPGFHSGMIFTR